MIRIMYDAAPEAVAAAPSFNPAEIMAKQGVKVDSEDSNITVPDIKTESVAAPVAPAEPVKTETVSQPGIPAAQPTADNKAPETKQAPASAATPGADWKQVLKGKPETEVLKELGYDDKLIGLLNRWKNGESVADYLKAASIDYSKISPEEVMRYSLREEYGDLSDEDFEELYRMKVTEAFKIDSDMYTEQEVKRGKILLNAEAKRAREQLIKKQQEFILSKPTAAQGASQEELEQQQREQQAAAIKEYREKIEATPTVMEFAKNKSIKIGEGEDAFNFTMPEPESILNLLFDGEAYRAKLANADGTPNIQKHILMAAIAEDDQKLLDEFAKHHRTLGMKKAIEPIENAVPPSGTPSKGEAVITDPAAALARGGTIVSGS